MAKKLIIELSDKMKGITDEMMELIKTEATVEANNYEYRMKEGE